MTTRLVLLGDYSNDQEGYNSAHIDGAVHVIAIDEQSYSALYNVQQAIQATCDCLGGTVSIGLVQDNKYIPLSLVEDTDICPNIEYGSLDTAFEIGRENIRIKAHNLNNIRANALNTLAGLRLAIKDPDEIRRVEKCINILQSAEPDQ